MLVAGVGCGLALAVEPRNYLGGLVPGVTWVLSGAVKGTIMSEMGAELLPSEAAFNRLRDAGLLFSYNEESGQPG